MSIVHRNKICERCFLCRSLTFCKACHQCPTCCFRSPCRGEVKPVLAEMGIPGFKSKSGKHTEGGLHSPLPVQTPLDKVTDCNKQLPQSNQTVLPYRGTVSADKQKCSRTGGQSKFIGVLQPAIFGTQTQQPVETHPRPEHLEHLFKHRVVQDGDPRDHKNLPPSRGVGHIHRFQRCILPYTHSQSVQEVHAFSPPGSVLSVQSPSLWPFHGSHGVHSGGQRGQTHGPSEGYKEPPVPRRLAGESLYPPYLSPAYSNPGHTLSGTRVAGEQGKVRTGTQTGLQLRRLPVRPERGQGQTNRRTSIQTWPDHSNRVVTSSSSIPSCMHTMHKVAPATSGPVCHQIQQQTAPVCVTGARPPGLGSRCTQSLLGGPGPIRLPTGSHLGQSGGEAPGLPLQQNNPDCPRVAQHALVLGPGSNVKPDPTVSAQPTQPSVSAIQPGPSQEPVKSEPTCLAPRASAIKEQGFSEAVAARIEAPQRRSTRSVYEAKWTIFTKWCLSNQVDFRAPPLKSIADFLLHLFQDKKLQPGTIDGYRSAIADKLGNSTINVSKDENLTRLLDSFYRDRPKGRRGIPSWNLSLVLHQLAKAPFEPLKESSLKHLTFKTVFLLALGSGKRRSEIHAWLHKNIRHQSDWSKVSLYPSPSFLSKNQLAEEGPDSVAPVVIPALAPSLDRSLKGDRSLCPVRALRYYLDRTADLRQNKELVFVSFKKGFDKDISPATISSWIKHTVVLCYELSDQEALTLHQVKAHDVRAFAASKAFQSGISLDQILSACHWKSHNTFTQFYLKDVAWADSELFHLGHVVAAQQVHHQAQK